MNLREHEILRNESRPGDFWRGLLWLIFLMALFAAAGWLLADVTFR